MLRGRRDRYHRLGLHHPVHRRGDRHADPDGRGRLARPLGLQQRAGEVRRHRAGARDRAATCPRRCSATSTPTATVVGGIPHPRARVVPVGSRARARAPSSRASTPFPPDDGRRSARSTSSTSAWDVMVGPRARCCSCCPLWYGLSLDRSGATCRRAGGSCGSRRPPASLSVIALEAGWVVTEVGRQPWIVYELHEGRGRRHRQHRRLDHVPRGRASSTSGWASPRSWSCAAMSRRFREAGEADADARRPVRPRAQPDPATDAKLASVRDVTAVVAVVLFVGDHRLRASSAAPTSAPGSGTSSPAAPSAARGRGRSSTTRSARCGKPTTSG